MDKDIYWYWLASMNEFGVAGIKQLMNWFGSPEQLFKASEKAILQYFNDKGKRYKTEKIIKSRDMDEIKRKYTNMHTKGIHFITLYNKMYPKRLKEIDQSPYYLFYRGELPAEAHPAIAIVGARVCSGYGRDMAIYMGTALSRAGVNVISGMASGIDGYAHYGALKEGYETYAVLGSGIDICYPQENIELYHKIKQCGGIISEYAPGIKGKPYHFPMRNRIISGLSDGILVVEAREKSGSLITVDYGLDQGKEIYVIPGRMNDKLSEGCLNLITQGAKLVKNIEDIIEDLRIKFDVNIQNSKSVSDFCHSKNKEHISENKSEKAKLIKINNNLLETDEKMVYASLSLVPKHLETILEETVLPVKNVVTALLQLELNDFIVQTAKNYYILSDKDGTI